MSFWSKLASIGTPILGGTAGFLLGGPLGAALGAGIGGSVGSGIANTMSQEEANKFNVQSVADTNATNLAIARENNEMQEKYYLQQMAQQEKFFDETQAYNSAGAQANRLRAAGLNPALAMYQGVNAGSVSAATAPAPPARQQATMQAPQISAVDYSPLANGISNSVSLLSEFPELIKKFEALKDVKRRVTAETYKSVGESEKALGEGKKAQAEGDVYQSVKKSLQKSIVATASKLESESQVASYDALVAEIKSSALLPHGKAPREISPEEHEIAWNSLFETLKQPYMSNKLTDKQIESIGEAMKKVESEIELMQGDIALSKAMKHFYEMLPDAVVGVVKAMPFVGEGIKESIVALIKGKSKK